MKILLADDDKLIRYSIKSMLAEISDFEFIITEASNGLEMVRRCNEFDPDIAFVDIRMPHLNGIEAIIECKKSSPDTEFVIITGYSDFEYAKKCISLNVSDYILKPVEAEYLNTIIRKLQKKLSNQMTQKNNLFQLHMHEYFLSSSHEVPSLALCGPGVFPEYCYLAFAIFIDCANDPKIYNEIRSNLTAKIKALGNQLVGDNMYYSIIYSPEGFLRLVMWIPKKETGTIKGKLEQLCRKFSVSNFRLYLFYTKHTDIGSVYDACEKMEEYQYIRIGMKAFEAVKIESLDFETVQLSFYKHLFNLITSFLEANEGLYTHNLNTIYRHYYDKETVFPLEHISAYVKCVIGSEVSADNFKAFMKSFVLISDKMYGNLEYKVTEKIDLILEYIQHSYMNDIGINQIASRFDLTPNYVSKLFHDKTNTKFIDYLTNIRISHAKKLLLSNSDTPIKEIALMVGYYSARHFSSIFKKITGYYPTEYRKTCISSDSVK
jgi:two-component system response regulator YesN